MKRLVGRSEQTVTVVVLESRWAETYYCVWGGRGLQLVHTSRWNPAHSLTDRDGTRVLDEVSRQVRFLWQKNGAAPSDVALTMPGTLDGMETIVSSSRLGIHEPVAAAKRLSEDLHVRCGVFHDVECLAYGEARQIGGLAALENETFVYVLADEGVGSKALIKGETHVGAGVAGLLGRLTVQPDGAYYKELASRGPLEVFSSRPWVSENLVASYLAEQDKRVRADSTKESEDSAFRRALRVAASGDWRSLDYAQISDGLASGDPIAVDVLEVAARYLGFALNCVLAVLHPHQMVLGGAMMTELPGFASQVIDHTRRVSWATAWNSTEMRVSSLGRRAQVHGAVELWSRNVWAAQPGQSRDPRQAT